MAGRLRPPLTEREEPGWMEKNMIVPVDNTNAKRLYHKPGFRETGRVHAVTDGLDEIELSMP